MKTVFVERIVYANTDINKEVRECPICYEEISPKVNNCITACNHSFCFTCIMRCNIRNDSCPICRTALLETNKEDNSDNDNSSASGSIFDSDNESDDNGSNISDEDEDEDEEEECSIEYITKMLKEKEYTMMDIVSIYINRFSKSNPKYTDQFCLELNNKFNDTINNLDKEKYVETRELKLMGLEDLKVVNLVV
jgi:hypothetical protein